MRRHETLSSIWIHAVKAFLLQYLHPAQNEGSFPGFLNQVLELTAVGGAAKIMVQKPVVATDGIIKYLDELTNLKLAIQEMPALAAHQIMTKWLPHAQAHVL